MTAKQTHPPEQAKKPGFIERAINELEDHFERGEAKELHERWEEDLKPQGFRLMAKILDFPDGFPGDAGLFLSWGG